MFLNRLLLICATLFIASCGSSTSTPVDDSTPTEMVAVPFKSISNIGFRGDINKPANAAANNPRDWTKLWNSTIGTDVPMPDVDFNSKMVIAVFAQGNTGGFGLEIKEVLQNNVSTIVKYRVSAPPPGSIVTQAFTNMSQFAIVPKHLNINIRPDVTFVAE
jgi:hypothetical protein